MAERRGLLNYTTGIDPARTVAEIMAVLSAHGAGNVNIDYVKGEPVALRFGIDVTPQMYQEFRLPANIEECWRTLLEQHRSGLLRSHGAQPTRQQAARVGWRILLDWVQAQLAIVETRMVRLEEVFLPYMLTGRGDMTLFQVMEQRLFLPPGRDAE